MPAGLKGEASALPVCGIPCPASLCHLELPLFPFPRQAVLVRLSVPRPPNLQTNQPQAFLLISCSVSAPYGVCPFNIFSLLHHLLLCTSSLGESTGFLQPLSCSLSHLRPPCGPPCLTQRHLLPDFLSIPFCCPTISCPHLFHRNF